MDMQAKAGLIVSVFGAVKECNIVNIVTVLMAGGVGNRLWPYSTPALPKQFLPLVTPEETLLQTTWKRVVKFTEPEKVLVLTSAAYVDIVADQLPDVPRQNILGEPVMRNTAAAISFAAMEAERRWPGSIHVVLPCDHDIAPAQRFVDTITTAVDLCRKDNKLYTIGIKPTRPSPEYGYIKSQHKDYCGDFRHFDVQRFVEKPDVITARSYIETGRYFWNAGIFVWQGAGIMEALKRYIPEHVTIMGRAIEAHAQSDAAAFEKHFADLPAISIDYAVMQPAGEEAMVRVVEGDFYWNDLGGWESVFDILKPDDAGNRSNYEQVFGESTDCTVFSFGDGHRFVLHDCADIAVIHTNNVTVISSRKALVNVPGLKNKVTAAMDGDDDI